MTICDDLSTWVLSQLGDIFYWREGPRIPDADTGPKRKPTAAISTGRLRGSMVICDDSTSWTLEEDSAGLFWRQAQLTPVEAEAPAVPEEEADPEVPQQN